MAAGFFRLLADPLKAVALSAGTKPGPHIHPEVIEVMRETGVDLSDAKPRLLSVDLAQGATLLVTMGCGEDCPYVPGLQRDDWPLPDPKGQPLHRVREIRDEVRVRVERLVSERGWDRSG
jgi:arsenate reductase